MLLTLLEEVPTVLLLLALACKEPAVVDSQPADDSGVPESPVDTSPPEPFSFGTPAWESGDEIPEPYTCDGAGGWNGQPNPELVWANAPEGTEAIAVIYLDITIGGWRHWAFFTNDPSLGGVPELTSNTSALPDGVIELVSQDGRRGYVPNCPGGSAHTYEFTIWAVGAPIELDGDAGFGQLRQAAEADALETLSFTGRSSAGG